jgi:hypothetical protein
METEGIELNDDTVSLDNITESIFNKAILEFSETFNEADLTIGSDNMGLSFTEKKSNVSECQQLIVNVKQIVNESYSYIFDVNVEREEWDDDDEFPDDVANIIINLNWGKIYKNS